MIFCLDFDGTLVDGPKPEGEDLAWLPGARETLDALLDAEHDVIVFSCRSNPDVCPPWMDAQMDDWFDAGGYFGRGRFAVHDGPGKPYADYYVDDRAIRLNPTGAPGQGWTWGFIRHLFALEGGKA